MVLPIESPGLFSNPDKVVIKTSENKVVLELPSGVKAKDVDKIIIVKPEVLIVTVKDTSKVPAQKVDDLLSKYGA